MSSTHDTATHAQSQKAVQRHASNPYATLGQLSYAPATQTTVVTTTTTTTTSFPPIILKAPRHLNDRDPKLYPLASSPTPNSIRQLQFDVGGQLAYFDEAGDVDRSLREFNEKHAALRASNGTVRTVKNFQTHHDTLSRQSKSNPSSRTAFGQTLLAEPFPQKRIASHISVAEAAELASLQRGNKRLRAAKDGIDPATPEEDGGIPGQFKALMSTHGVRKTSLGGSTSQRAGHQLCGQSKAYSDPVVPHSNDTPLHDCLSVTGDDTGYAADTQFPALTDETVAALSTTPPLAESDLQPLPAFEQELAGPSRLRPSPLDTSSVQDASLPSPSLSPVTAAANLHDHIGFGSSLFLHLDPNARYSPNVGTPEHGSRAQDVSMVRKRHVSTKAKHIEMPLQIEGCSPNAQLPTPTLMDIPTLLDTFDGMPTEMQTYVMYQLLRRCAKPTLHFVADVVNPALKCDFIGLLPLELSLNIVKYLDVKTMCRAAQVSKRWRQIIDSDEKAWKDLLDQDGHVIPEGEVERAVKEGWGWQFPQDSNSWERDLSAFSPPRSDAEASPRPSSSSLNQDDSESTVISCRTSSRLKRRAIGKCLTNKRQKRKICGESTVQATIWSRSLDMSQGPNAFANAAALAVPNPQVGLPSLRNLHLFKSLYQRHHSIRESWMNESIKPHHLAFRAHQQHVVTCLQFDTDKILSGSDDTNINVYDTKTGAMRKVLKGHEGGVWALQYEGNTLVSGSTDRSVRVWDIEKGKCLQVFQGHTSTVRCLVILKPTEIGKRSDGTPIVMPKEPLIITGSRDSSLRVWKLPQPSDRSVFQTGPPANDHDNPYFVRALTGHHHSVRAIAAHGDTLVSGSYDFTVRVWKISTGDTVHRLQGHAQKVYSVVLDHKRNRCISGSMDNLVKVWSLETGACLFNLEGHSSLVGLLDLSHDRLVSAAADSTLRIWDPENGQCKSTLSAHTGAITCFQHDGQKVISGSDRTLKMWNVQNGTCIRDLLTDLSGVWQVKFNERRCVAAVQRNQWTYIEVLDFGAARDGVPATQRGVRIVVDENGHDIVESDDADESATA